MYRFKVVIADDELYIRKGLQLLIEEKFDCFDIVSLCKNGSELFDYIKSNPVDILITDIQMPFFSGLDVAKYIHEKNLAIKTIITTGYREFEYAKRALDYKVFAVLLKPISFPDFVDAMKAVRDSIIDNTKSVLEETRIILLLRERKREFLIQMLSGLISPDDLLDANRFSPFDASIEQRFCAVINFKQNVTFVNFEMDMILWRDMGEIETNKIDAYCLSADENKIQYFLFVNEDDFDCGYSLVEIFSNELIVNMEKSYGIKATYDIRFQKSISDFKNEKIEHAVCAYLKYLTKKGTSEIDELLTSIKSQYSTPEICRFLEAVEDQLKDSIDIADIKISSLVSKVKSKTSAVELLGLINEQIKYKMAEKKNVLIDIIEYINTNYSSDLSLKTIVQKFYFSPAYLSRVFKNEVGENIADYIMNLRINKAKELILTKKYTMNQIAEMVGYSNSQYFHRVFKKVTGVTPRDYFLVSNKG